MVPGPAELGQNGCWSKTLKAPKPAETPLQIILLQFCSLNDRQMALTIFFSIIGRLFFAISLAVVLSPSYFSLFLSRSFSPFSSSDQRGKVHPILFRLFAALSAPEISFIRACQSSAPFATNTYTCGVLPFSLEILLSFRFSFIKFFFSFSYCNFIFGVSSIYTAVAQQLLFLPGQLFFLAIF